MSTLQECNRSREQIASLLLIVALSWCAWADDRPAASVKSSLESLGVSRGICVILGDKELALGMAEAGNVMVFTQSPDAQEVESLRKAADSRGFLGTRLTVVQGPWSRLQLANDLADGLIVSDSVGREVNREEIVRVLRPAGKAIIGREEIVKPYPTGIDDWSHPYHGPDNNPQSNDFVARAPYLTHFLAEPWYCPMPLVTVASDGRLFKAFGHIAVKQREWPLLSTLICQNAYNGTVLWQRKLNPSFMIHRSTMIATPELLYLADDTSCKRIDAATGKVRDEIVSSPEDGPVWKWMALVDGTLLALVGQSEEADPTVRGDRKARGWPWGGPLGKGYNSKNYPWGFGNTILAIDVKTKSVIWRHREETPLDTRGMCLANGRLFFYSHGNFLGCLDAKSGKPLWKSDNRDALDSIGEHKFAQNPQEGFSSSAFIKASDQALYFAGPTRTDLAAISAEDGTLLWKQPAAGNSQLVLRRDGLYAMSPKKSSKFDLMSGKILADLGPRVNCTRATGSADSIFVRGGGDGTIRYDLTSVEIRQQNLGPMRPSCQDGVIPAFGHLYWGPWMCDCNLTLVGVVSLAPAGSFDFVGNAQAAERLETSSTPPASLEVSERDWPTLRANNTRTAYSRVSAPTSVKQLWTFEPNSKSSTSISAVGDLVFASGLDGSVRAIDSVKGALRWSTYTGGPIHYAPTIAHGRVYVGSSDGWVYCLDAASGSLAWRYRAAPAERLIPVYGSLCSTWPVASGVLVQDGVAYAAAGMANHDGTHIYALDASSGKVKWHNHASGALQVENGAGVSVNGHLLLSSERLYAAGGNMVPVGSYRLEDGQCTAEPAVPQSHTKFRAGSDLFLVGDQVEAGGSPLYSSRGDYRMVNQGILQTPAGDVVIAYGPHDSRIALHRAGEGSKKDSQPVWQQTPINRIAAIAVAANAVLVAGNQDATEGTESPKPLLVALSLQDGQTLWSHPLPALPSSWGLLIDRAGRIVVSLEDGRIVALGNESR